MFFVLVGALFGCALALAEFKPPATQPLAKQMDDAFTRAIAKLSTRVDGLETRVAALEQAKPAPREAAAPAPVVECSNGACRRVDLPTAMPTAASAFAQPTEVLPATGRFKWKSTPRRCRGFGCRH